MVDADVDADVDVDTDIVYVVRKGHQKTRVPVVSGVMSACRRMSSHVVACRRMSSHVADVVDIVHDVRKGPQK